MTTEFTALNLRPELMQAIAALGYTQPTPIQAEIIPLMLAGADVTGQAQTGTGKTAAFALPILNNLEPGQRLPQALVVAPTRELALQVSEMIAELGQFMGVRVLAIYGGSSYSRQISALKRGVDVVVGTPGRLLDLMERGVLKIQQVRTVVLDEADEMLSMGFIEDIETILAETPAIRQTTLFSATLPAPIRRLAERYMNDPQSVAFAREQITVAAIEQRYYLVNKADKSAALTRLFEMEAISSALIFVRTRAGTGELVNELSKRGFASEALNGDLSQEARERTLNRFRQGQAQVLVATDVAARGLDIDDISHVFNYDMPDDAEIYVHRIGRTGRAGKTGIAISLVTPAEKRRLRAVENFTKQQLTRANLPTIEEIQARRQDELLEQINIWLQRGRCKQEQAIVETLVAGGADPLEIAAVALKMARGGEKQRPIAPINEVSTERADRGGREPRRSPNGRPSFDKPYAKKRSARGEDRGSASHEEGMVRLTMNMGRQHGIHPNDVVGAIAHHADIPGATIGKILIEDKYTLVDVPAELVGQVLGQAGRYNIRKQAFTVERA
ncbi:MAG: DEAD/DEAH box helicase [Chloroflexota bacterium]